MGQAILQRLREETLARPKVLYFGVLFEKEGKEAEQLLQEKVYKSWDSDPHSPPSTRPRDPLPDPNLQILGWQEQAPFFPESLVQKFAQGTAGHKRVLEMKSELESAIPTAASTSGAAGGSVRVQPRAGGRPDYTVEGGAQPLDPHRCVDLPLIQAASFSETRLLSVDGTRAKPALFLSTDMELFLGNTTNEEITYNAIEICGFNTGSYEQKIVTGQFLGPSIQ
eukprot:Skav216070  [mRNA]  locus=scaffold389:183362:184141:- [translate_table: standard]